MTFNSLIFTDETEVEKNVEMNQDLIIHFNGIYFPIEIAPMIKYDMEPLVEKMGRRGFSSKKFFNDKSNTNYDLMRSLVDIIIRHKLIWLNFGFEKKLMKDKRIKPLLDMEFPEMDFQKNNYRAYGFYLYFHSIHYYNEQNRLFKPKIRIYADKDTYLRVGQVFTHSGEIIKSIEQVIGSKGKDEPFLYLADLVGFIFRRVKSKIGSDFKSLTEERVDKLDILTKECLMNLMKIVNEGLFKYMDLFETLPTE